MRGSKAVLMRATKLARREEAIMKRFNKRPSKAAVNKAIEFYRTEAKNTDEQLTVPCSDMCIHSIRDYAVAVNVK